MSGGVWDLLFIPSLFLEAGAVKRVLLLGVGGGAVIRQYLTFMQIEKLVGVELDPMHLKKNIDCRYGFTLPSYGNSVGVFLASEVAPAAMRSRLDSLLVKYPESRRTAQRFRVRRVC